MSYSVLASHFFDFGYIFKNFLGQWYYYLAGAAVIAAVVIFALFVKKSSAIKLDGARKTAYISVLVALSVVANVFDIKVSDDLQISLVATVCFIGGYLFGGGIGFAIGFTGDLLGAFINPHGAYNPIIGIGTGLWGFISGVAFCNFKGNDYVKAIVAFVISFFVISAGVNTLGIYLMYFAGKKEFAPYFFGALPWKAIGVAANAAVTCLLLGTIKRIYNEISNRSRYYAGERSESKTTEYSDEDGRNYSDGE